MIGYHRRSQNLTVVESSDLEISKFGLFNLIMKLKRIQAGVYEVSTSGAIYHLDKINFVNSKFLAESLIYFQLWIFDYE